MKDDYTLWLFQRIRFLDLPSLIIWSYRIGVISSRLSGHSTLEHCLCDGSVHQGVSQVTMKFICCHLWRPGTRVIQSLTWGILSEKILNKRKDGRGSSREMISVLILTLYLYKEPVTSIECCKIYTIFHTILAINLRVIVYTVWTWFPAIGVWKLWWNVPITLASAL